MTFLLDTDVLSALRRRERNPAVARWIEAQRDTDLYLSVVTVGEIERGIFQQRRHDPSFAEELARWLDLVLGWYEERVLTVDISHGTPLGATVGRPWTRQRGLADSPRPPWNTA